MEPIEPIPSRTALEREYREALPDLERVLAETSARVRGCLEKAGYFPTCKQRLKSFNSYFAKRVKFFRASRAANAPSLPVTDILGMRLICPFIGDLERVEEALASCFTIVEVERKGAERSFKEFGYESTHLLIRLTADMGIAAGLLAPPVCEIQIRTILQDAWAEVEHELIYKTEFTPFDEPIKRKLAALNANLTLSDMLFQEIRDHHQQLTTELAKRRVTFFKKIEDAIDGQFQTGTPPARHPEQLEPHDPAWMGTFRSMDDLLLEALNAHNRADYVRAIDIYSHILALKPKTEIQAIIHQHRGMAYFSESRYDEAVEDFSATLSLDPKCYKAAYYRGVVHSVRMNYGAAIDDFNEALDIQPYHFYATFRRSQAYYHLGDYPKSLADCEAALELEPSNEALLNLKRMVLNRLKA